MTKSVGRNRWLAIAVLLALAAPVAAAEPASDHSCPRCAGQIVYRDVVSHRCKLVPETKQIKQAVYEVKEVPFCLHKLPPLLGRHHDCCDECRACGCVRYKKVLVKREIVCDEICTSKCVVEAFSRARPLPRLLSELSELRGVPDAGRSTGCSAERPPVGRTGIGADRAATRHAVGITQE
ncbi:MAG: hypothetical protein WD872_05090 [Pirellulaceae bacterium]